MQNQVSRYSTEELEEFRLLIVKKMEGAQGQLDSMERQINELTDDDNEHGMDMVDDSTTASQIEMLGTMVIRQRQHLRDLENALLRVQNKSYGICIVTGELIDKKRLLAVLTTTKSIAGKTIEATPVKKETKPVVVIKGAPIKTISRIIKKVVPPNNELLAKVIQEDDDLDDDIYDDDDNDDEILGLEEFNEEIHS